MATKHVIRVTLHDGTIAYSRNKKYFEYFTTNINDACVYTKAMIPDVRIKELENKIKSGYPHFPFLLIGVKKYNYSAIIKIEKIEVKEIKTITVVEA